MKNKKGFTLIELLAVIVILAIIALIATTIIIGVIENARKKAFENTAYGVLETLRLDYVESVMNEEVVEDTFNFPTDKLKISGEQPAGGTATIDKDGNIAFALFDKDKKWCAKKHLNSEKVYTEDYEEETCNLDGIELPEEKPGDGGNEGGTGTPMTNGTAVYFDPTTGKKCDTYTEANSASEVKTGCMKWYTFGGNNDSDKVNLLLDHNTTAKVAWNTNDNNKDSSQINAKVASDASGWTSGLNPRLITADEIAEITGANLDSTIKWNSTKAYDDNHTANPNTNTSWFYLDGSGTTYSNTNGWHKQVANSSNISKYAWLFDRTNECTSYGCSTADNSTYGYWTSTAVAGSSSHVWNVDINGDLDGNTASVSSLYGIRPVITVSKSLIL